MYKCLYNLELLIIATAKTPFQSYQEPIKAETPANYIYELQGTDVDAVMICPTAWKRPLWNSSVDPHWKEEAPNMKQPYFTTDLKYYEKAYFRLRDYLMSGNDPVAVAVEAAKKTGIAPFISYRMNDHHYLQQKEAVVHPKFWRDHPQFWLGYGANYSDGIGAGKAEQENRHFDYMHEEVRDYYFSLLSELAWGYDIAGLELDFMRTPVYFKKEEVEQGRDVMTGFVRRIRGLLDEVGKSRGKDLKLCVRIPYTPEWSYEIGLDIERWDREGLIDMANLSTFFINSPEIHVEEYKSLLHHTTLYGEMHFIVDKATIPGGYSNNCTRKTTKEMYQALAAAFLDRGLDGISFFNTAYARHHFFEESRRYHLADGEPPFSAFSGISDLKELAKRDKHYLVGPYYSVLPMENELDLQLYIADENVKDRFQNAILRIKTQEPCHGLTIQATVNGYPVKEILWMGELFTPLSIEGMTAPEYVKYYLVPTDILCHGRNRICAVNLCDDPTVWDKKAIFNMVELALYKQNSFIEM